MTVVVLVGSGLVAAPPRVEGATQEPPSTPAAADEVSQLRRELEALRDEYGSRMAAIESRIAALEASGAAAATPTPAEAPVSPPTAEETRRPASPAAEVPAGAAGGGTAGTLPVYGGPAAASKIFNPDIAAIGDFVGVAGPSPGSGEPSLSLQESELSFQAIVDPYARADFFLTFGPEEVGVEEGYITFPALPGGFLMKVGKMREAFGRVNTEHPHTLPFADLPLISRNLLGGEALSDSGMSIARLVPIPWFFLEATGQVYSGSSDVFAAPTRRDLQYLGRLRAYQDLSESTNIDLGGSIAYGHNGVRDTTTTRLLGVDATLRWKPLRRAIYTHVLARGEVAWSRREEEGGALAAVGGYGYLEYQFARRWTAGIRYDNSERAEAPGLRDTGASFILTYKPSEFSLVRAQYRRTSFALDDSPTNELLFQFLFAIGAHGAHPF